MTHKTESLPQDSHRSAAPVPRDPACPQAPTRHCPPVTRCPWGQLCVCGMAIPVVRGPQWSRHTGPPPLTSPRNPSPRSAPPGPPVTHAASPGNSVLWSTWAICVLFQLTSEPGGTTRPLCACPPARPGAKQAPPPWPSHPHLLRAAAPGRVSCLRRGAPCRERPAARSRGL